MIITLSREFGSGGRELGRRLAEELGIEYYDNEILAAIAEKTSLSEEYVHQVFENKPHALFPITVGQSLQGISQPTFFMQQDQAVWRAQRDIVRDLAEKSDCVIVGRCADYILRDLHPFRIFCYADFESRVKRCVEHSRPEENMTEKKMRKKIRYKDKNRARYYRSYTGQIWGDRRYFDLLINTTDTDIRVIVPYIADMLRHKITKAETPAEEQ